MRPKCKRIAAFLYDSVFEVVGKSIVPCGPVGYARLTKICHQILCCRNLLGSSEAITFAECVGSDTQTMLRAVSTRAAGSCAMDDLGSRLLCRDFPPMFLIDLQQKELWITLSTGQQEKLPLPGTALVSQLLAANPAGRNAGTGQDDGPIGEVTWTDAE